MTPEDSRFDDRAELDQCVDEIKRLRAAIVEHRSQKADDRCIEDDDRLYAVLGDGIKCDRRVGDRMDMLANCARFIQRRCAGGGWPSYVELEATNKQLTEEVARLTALRAAPVLSEMRVSAMSRLHGECNDLEATLEQLKKERTETVAMLRLECGCLGDNNWEDELHLADVVEKHLADKASETIERLRDELVRVKADRDVFESLHEDECEEVNQLIHKVNQLEESKVLLRMLLHRCQGPAICAGDRGLLLDIQTCLAATRSPTPPESPAAPAG